MPAPTIISQEQKSATHLLHTFILSRISTRAPRGDFPATPEADGGNDCVDGAIGQARGTHAGERIFVTEQALGDDMAAIRADNLESFYEGL